MQAPLNRLIYRSQSLLPGMAEERLLALDGILQHAREKNAQAGLTGVLLFDGETFLQLVEGSMPGLENLYATLACDSRHENIDLIDLMPIGTREYGRWDMAFLDGANPAHSALRRFFPKPKQQDLIGMGDALSEAMKPVLSGKATAWGLVGIGVAVPSAFPDALQSP